MTQQCAGWLIVFAVVAMLAACCVAACGEEAPNLLDLPPDLRSPNYARGSCLHAAIQDTLKWHGLHDMAAWWRANRRGALGVDRAAGMMESVGLRYAYTTSGDEEFLEWCSRNRHGAAIHYFTGHAVTFLGYADGKAVLIDNNRPKRLIRVDKAAFIRRWKGFGGRAITVVYSPYPPAPRN